MSTSKKTPLTVIAERIDAHLNRFEADSKINKGQRYDREMQRWVEDPKGTGDYYCSSAYVSGRYISVVYITYQGSSQLTRERAEKYLAWLDAGNVGRHFEAEQASPEAREFMSRFENKKRLK